MMPISFSNGQKLQLPHVVNGTASPGKRVAITTPEYTGTTVHHLLYLPPDWESDWKESGFKWPVIVEYTGNRYPVSGSTGEVEGAALGYGLSAGKFIWIVLPYIATDMIHNEDTWWGDEKATVEYAKLNVPRICSEYGGDTTNIFLCGFSRGAIGVNYLGLYDDEIARLWCGFITHDNYDGLREWKGTTWGSPLQDYRRAAYDRLQRLNGRPVLVCQNGGTENIELYLTDYLSCAKFTFLDVPVNKIFPVIPNELMIHTHTDRWMFVDSRARRKAWNWLDRNTQKKRDGH